MEEDHQINSNINVHNINSGNQMKNRKQIFEQLSKSCGEIVRNININNAYFNVFLLLVILIQAANISYLYLICFLWLFDIQELYKQVVFLRNIKKNVQNYLPAHQLLKRRIKLEILDCLVGFFFKLCIVLYEEKQISTMVAPSIIAFSYFGIHIILRILCHRAKSRLGQQEQEEETGVLESIQVLEAQQQTNSFYFIINNWVFRIYIVTQALFYSLKSEGWINWSWGEVFWVFWVFFCVFVGVTLVIFLLMVVKVCDYCAGSPKEMIEIIGLIWFFLIMGLISANSCYTVLQYCVVLADIDDTRDTYNKTDADIAAEQNNLVASRDYLYHIVIQISIGFAVQFSYYVLFRKKIVQFVKLIMFEFDEEDLEAIGKDLEQLGGQQNQHQQQEDDHDGQHNKDNHVGGNGEPADGQDNHKEEEQQKPKKVRMAYKSKFILEEQKVLPAVNLPQFVSKVSSTYFKLLTGGKDFEQEVDQRKEQLEKKKKEKKRKISTGQQMQKEEVEKQNNLQQLQRLKNKRNPAGSSIKSLNRSATATGTLSTQGAMTLNTQGTMNTQADMLGSFRGVFSGNQNELEDVLSDESNKQGEKKDVRAENFNKKNVKALNRQKLGPREEGNVANSSIFEDTNPNQSKKTTKNLVITLAGKGKDEVGMLKLDDVIASEKHIGAVISPVCGNGESPMFASPSNFGNTQGNSSSRRHISLATTFKQPLGDQNIAMNRTAPFQALSNPYDEDIDQHGIKEEDDEEHGSYLDDGHQTSHKTKQQHRDTQGGHEHETIALSEDSHNHSQQQESILSSSQQPSVANCLVCFDSQPDALFNPCGHGGLCYECAIDLLKKTAECLLCRTKIDEVLKIDIESKSLGIMKILTSTKFIKIREKIEITEQEYQYYSALQRNRRNMAGGGADGSAPQPLPPLPQHSSPLQFHRLQDQHVQRQEGQEELGRVQTQLLEQPQVQQPDGQEGELQQQQQQQQPEHQDLENDRYLREDQVLHDDGVRQNEHIVQDQGQNQEQINSGRQHSQELGDNPLLNK